MKYWPSSARCGPTTGPPLRTSQLVAANNTSPARSPVTTPAIAAFRRTTRTSTRASRSFVSVAMRRLLDEFEESLQELSLGAAPQEGQREEQGQVADHREAPARQEAAERAVDETDHGAGGGDGVAGQELREQAERRSHHGSALPHEDEGREAQQRPGHQPGRRTERHSVHAGEDLGDAPIEHRRF